MPSASPRDNCRSRESPGFESSPWELQLMEVLAEMHCISAGVTTSRVRARDILLRQRRLTMPVVRQYVTSEDEFHATFYLSGRIRNYGFQFCDSVSYPAAESDYRNAINEPTREKRATALNAWCAKYLSKADTQRLRTAVRKRRERWRRSDATKTVTISAKAHKLLTQISKRDTVTFSEALEHYLSNALNSARSRVGSRKTS